MSIAKKFAAAESANQCTYWHLDLSDKHAYAPAQTSGSYWMHLQYHSMYSSLGADRYNRGVDVWGAWSELPLRSRLDYFTFEGERYPSFSEFRKSVVDRTEDRLSTSIGRAEFRLLLGARRAQSVHLADAFLAERFAGNV